MSEIKFRVLITLLLVIWLSLGTFLILFWSELPAYVSWPLSILEFLICADGRMFRIALGREKVSTNRANGDSDS